MVDGKTPPLGTRFYVHPIYLTNTPQSVYYWLEPDGSLDVYEPENLDFSFSVSLPDGDGARIPKGGGTVGRFTLRIDE